MMIGFIFKSCSLPERWLEIVNLPVPCSLLMAVQGLAIISGIVYVGTIYCAMCSLGIVPSVWVSCSVLGLNQGFHHSLPPWDEEGLQKHCIILHPLHIELVGLIWLRQLFRKSDGFDDTSIQDSWWITVIEAGPIMSSVHGLASGSGILPTDMNTL